MQSERYVGIHVLWRFFEASGFYLEEALCIPFLYTHTERVYQDSGLNRFLFGQGVSHKYTHIYTNILMNIPYRLRPLRGFEFFSSKKKKHSIREVRRLVLLQSYFNFIN